MCFDCVFLCRGFSSHVALIRDCTSPENEDGWGMGDTHLAFARIFDVNLVVFTGARRVDGVEKYVSHLIALLTFAV